jgi:hypothetical protein
MEIKPLTAELDDIRRRAEALVNDLNPDQLIQRPDPAKWSIAECVAHLNITAKVVQPLIAKAIERGKKDKLFGTGPFALGFRGRTLIWIAQPPPKFRIRAPKDVAPPVTIADPTQLFPEFLKIQDGWQRLWNEAEGLDMARINIGRRLSPFFCHLSAAFPWMMAHQHRHLLQAEKVKAQLGRKQHLPIRTKYQIPST